jgi:hypothetical protein
VSAVECGKDNGNANDCTEADQQPDRQTMHDCGIHGFALEDAFIQSKHPDGRLANAFWSTVIWPGVFCRIQAQAR